MSRVPPLRYVASLNNEADVLRYTAQTFLVPFTPWEPAGPTVSEELALGGGRAWLVRSAIRRLAGDGPAIGAATIVVLAELEPALATIDLSRPRALYVQLVEACELRLQSIEQEIYATSLSAQTPAASAQRADRPRSASFADSTPKAPVALRWLAPCTQRTGSVTSSSWLVRWPASAE